MIVFDQWGVLHNGSAPYPGAIEAVGALTVTCAVLSNSGKRSGPNAARITGMGFAGNDFDYVMTSGEALWRDIARGHIPARRFYPVEHERGDGEAWAEDLPIEIVQDVRKAEAVLMMGLPDGENLDDWDSKLRGWKARGLPIYCSNPDRQSPRAGGLVLSPGALAHAYSVIGGMSVFYGKPHRPVFRALEEMFGDGRYLMVGDSMEHDIAGAQGVGWDSLLIEGGLYADRFEGSDGDKVTAQIATEKQCLPPTFRVKGLR